MASKKETYLRPLFIAINPRNSYNTSLEKLRQLPTSEKIFNPIYDQVVRILESKVYNKIETLMNLHKSLAKMSMNHFNQYIFDNKVNNF